MDQGNMHNLIGFIMKLSTSFFFWILSRVRYFLRIILPWLGDGFNKSFSFHGEKWCNSTYIIFINDLVQPTNQPTTQPANHPASQPANQPTNEPTNKPNSWQGPDITFPLSMLHQEAVQTPRSRCGVVVLAMLLLVAISIGHHTGGRLPQLKKKSLPTS